MDASNRIDNISAIYWDGNNLREILEFTGKNKNFHKWFKDFDEYSKYVREHGNVFKIFKPDGSHYECKPGTWLVFFHDMDIIVPMEVARPPKVVFIEKQ